MALAIVVVTVVSTVDWSAVVERMEGVREATLEGGHPPAVSGPPAPPWERPSSPWDR